MLVLGYAYALWTAVHLPADHVSHHLSPTPVTLEGQVLRRAKVGPTEQRSTSRHERSQAETAVFVSGRVRITAYDFEPTVEAGDIVRVRHLRLRQPAVSATQGPSTMVATWHAVAFMRPEAW
jgi:hypothetical protein